MEREMMILHDNVLAAWDFTKGFDGERFDYRASVVTSDKDTMEAMLLVSQTDDTIFWKDRNWIIINLHFSDQGKMVFNMKGIYPC